MNTTLKGKIAQAQKHIQESSIDAWVIYQFIDRNDFFDTFIGEKIIASRRTFLVIPKFGEAILVHSQVDGGFEEIGMQTRTYGSYDEFLQVTKEIMAKYHIIAMEYSPNSKIPHVSKVDGGIIDVFKSMNLQVVSSADLLQQVGSLTDKQIESHLEAAKLLDEVREKAFTTIEKNLKEGGEVSEYSIQQLILRFINEVGMETIYEPEININANAAKPHYLPTKEQSLPFNKGDLLLIDMWAKLKTEGSIYADITWMLYRGDAVPTKIENAFQAVIKGRDAAVTFLQERIRNKQPVYGWEVDKVARDSITADGYGKYFTHRLGHSLGTFVHGNLVHFDNYENIDERQVMNNHLGTIEPGVYIPNDFGIRSEINVLVKDSDVIVTTSLQKTIYYITV